MQFTTLAVAAIACFASSASAASAIVRNNCGFPIYLQNSPNGGGASSPVMTIPASTGTYSIAYAGTGSAIKLGVTPRLSAPLTLEYTPSGATVYYDISNNAGNPFNGNTVTLRPSDASCPAFNCAPNSGNACYSNGASPKVKACQSGSSLTVTLCA